MDFNLNSSKNSSESSAICKIISVPLVFFLAAEMVYSVDPSQTHLAASDLSWYDFDTISTSLATMKAE